MHAEGGPGDHPQEPEGPVWVSPILPAHDPSSAIEGPGEFHKIPISPAESPALPTPSQCSAIKGNGEKCRANPSSPRGLGGAYSQIPRNKGPREPQKFGQETKGRLTPSRRQK